MLMAAYSAFLISSLAVQHQHLPFRDLQGLLYDGSYRLGVLRNTFQSNMFDVCGRKYLWPNYFVGVGLGLWEKLLRGENQPIKRALYNNYFKANWGVKFTSSGTIILKKKFYHTEDILPAAISLQPQACTVILNSKYL